MPKGMADWNKWDGNYEKVNNTNRPAGVGTVSQARRQKMRAKALAREAAEAAAAAVQLLAKRSLQRSLQLLAKRSLAHLMQRRQRKPRSRGRQKAAPAPATPPAAAALGWLCQRGQEGVQM